MFVEAPDTRSPSERPPQLLLSPAAHEQVRSQHLCQYPELSLKNRRSFARFTVGSGVSSFSCELVVCLGLSPDLRQHLG